MNREDILSGKAGVGGIQWALNGQSSRRLIRSEAQTMLRDGYHPGSFNLTRAKFKPDRKLSAYYTFPALNANGQVCDTVHLAVSWEKHLNGSDTAEVRHQLKADADRSGILPVQRELWKELLDQGIQLQVWPLDSVFPQLVRLSDPSYAARLFTSLGIAQNLKSLPKITPIRYRPGERHVLRYEIASPEGLAGRARRIYAKLYVDEQDATRAFRVANRVVDWLADNNLGVQGNKPQAISIEDGVIFYPDASGIPLSHQLNRSHRWLADQMHEVGKALAVLHNGPGTLQTDLKQNTFFDEVRVVKRASEHIQVLLPETYTKILEILDIVEERYSNLPQEKPTFTHSDFKADHLLTTSQGLTLIDFDTCTLTDPALDIGKFLADLEWWFTQKQIPGVVEAQAELLKGYFGKKEPEQLVYDRILRARLFYALILVKIVVRRVPLFQKEWAATTASMIEHAAQVLRNKKDGFTLEAGGRL